MTESKTCPTCGKSKPLNHTHWNRSRHRGEPWQARCKQCQGKRAHVQPRRTLSDRPAMRQEICVDDRRGKGCYGLPHRRPVSGCPKCGGAYVAAKSVTVEDVFRIGCEDRRVVPG